MCDDWWCTSKAGCWTAGQLQQHAAAAWQRCTRTSTPCYANYFRDELVTALQLVSSVCQVCPICGKVQCVTKTGCNALDVNHDSGVVCPCRHLIHDVNWYYACGRHLSWEVFEMLGFIRHCWEYWMRCARSALNVHSNSNSNSADVSA